MLRVNGLYGHIRRNAAKSVLLLLGFFVLVAVFWASWCVIYAAVADYLALAPKAHHGALTVAGIWRHGLEIAWRNDWVPPVLTLLWFANAYAFHDDIIDAETGAVGVERRQEPRLYNLVETLAINAGVPMPRVQVIEVGERNAYASGRLPSNASIAVTRGLLDALDDIELEAVLAHEMTHIVNYDVSFMAVATVFVGGLTLVGNWVGNLFSADDGTGWWLFTPSRTRRSSSDKEDGASFAAVVLSIVIAVALLALVHLFAILIRLAISRSREYMADAGSAELTKRPEALVSALRKIEDDCALPGVADNVMAMMICGGGTGWFDTHPSTEDRVTALQRFAGASADAPYISRPRVRGETEARTTFGKRRAA